MSEENEIVVVDIPHVSKIQLYGQVTSQMEKLGFCISDYESLELGFDLPVDWPLSGDRELTLAELVVLARKLKMRIFISDVSMEPFNKEKSDGSDSRISG